MQISPEGTIGIGLGLLALAGSGAIMIFPNQLWIGWTMIAVAAAGALWLMFHQFGMRQQSTLPVFGMIVFGLGFVGCAVWYFWPVASESVAPPTTKTNASRLFAQCEMVASVITPPDGRVYVVQINAIPAPYGIGLGVSAGKPGDNMNWGVRPIFRCQFTNYSVDPIFKVSVAFHMIFSEAIKDKVTPTSSHSGAVTLDRDWIVEIPKIDVGRDVPFTIYWFNMTSQFVRVTLASKVTLPNGEVIDLIQPASTEMIFSPNAAITAP